MLTSSGEGGSAAGSALDRVTRPSNGRVVRGGGGVGEVVWRSSKKFRGLQTVAIGSGGQKVRNLKRKH